jgi:DtxR family manganese transport transcriptional regulator
VAEDYVEIIADLTEAFGEARVADIAERVGVTHVTVSRTVARLERDGLVTRRPYRAIFLTPAGRRLALAARRRHQIIVDFLRSLGISERTACIDAEGIEHHVSEETLSAFAKAAKAAK